MHSTTDQEPSLGRRTHKATPVLPANAEARAEISRNCESNSVSVFAHFAILVDSPAYSFAIVQDAPTR